MFTEFLEIFPPEPTIRFLKEHDFGDSFNKSNINSLNDFVATWGSVEKEFLNAKLEKRKKELYSEAERLAMEIATRTVSVRGHNRLSVYPDESRKPGRPRPQDVIEDAKILNTMASEFVPKYELFVRNCRKMILK